MVGRRYWGVMRINVLLAALLYAADFQFRYNNRFNPDMPSMRRSSSLVACCTDVGSLALRATPLSGL
jgi:ABC-type uncharacterized transport system permease subunit